jgi:hypothetical protein
LKAVGGEIEVDELRQNWEILEFAEITISNG